MNTVNIVVIVVVLILISISINCISIIGDLFSVQELLPKYLRSFIVYRCACPSIYIGEIIITQQIPKTLIKSIPFIAPLNAISNPYTAPMFHFFPVALRRIFEC